MLIIYVVRRYVHVLTHSYPASLMSDRSDLSIQPLALNVKARSGDASHSRMSRAAPRLVWPSVSSRVCDFCQSPLNSLEAASRARTVSPRDRKSTRLNSSHYCASRMPSSACNTKNDTSEHQSLIH